MCECECMGLELIEDYINALQQKKISIDGTERYYNEIQANLLLLYQIKDKLLKKQGEVMYNDFKEALSERYANDEEMEDTESCNCNDNITNIEVNPGQTIHLNITNRGF